PPPVYRTTSRMYVPSQAPIPFPIEAEDDRLLTLPTPTPSPLTPLSSLLPHILPPPTHTIPTYAEAPLGYRAKRLCLAPGPRFKVGESSTAAAKPTGGYRADCGFIGTLDAELRHDRVREMGYGITDVWEDLAKATEEVPPTIVAELSQWVTNLITTVRQDMDEIYTTSLDTQLIAALGRIDTLEAREPAQIDDLKNAVSYS
nr:hypothetical protein [Tanacetum cinerariifolium]